MLRGINISYLIGLKPEEAIKYLERKGFVFSWNWRDTWQEAHNTVFTVSKAMKLEILQSIRKEMEKALNEGITFREFARNLEPRLKKLGWWGKVKVKDVPGYKGINPEQTVQLGSPHRLKIIYDTNLKTSLAAGRYKQQLSNAKSRPYWLYLQIQRPTFRHNHAKLHNKVFMYNDPIWKTVYPPNGFNCGCRVVTLTKKEMEQEGRKVTKGSTIKFTPDEGWAYNPGEETFSIDKNRYDADIAGNL